MLNKTSHVRKCNTEALSHNHCCRGKAISMTCSECVFVALVIQLEKGMRRFVSSSVACPALQNFSILLDELITYSGPSDGS